MCVTYLKFVSYLLRLVHIRLWNFTDITLSDVFDIHNDNFRYWPKTRHFTTLLDIIIPYINNYDIGLPDVLAGNDNFESKY